MGSVKSKDGTPIAYDRAGSGPAVILIGGAFVDRSENAGLADELARHFTVYNYDRRGRGASGDTLPYAVEREIEDIAALIAEAGGAAHLYGVSSGAGLTLEAAAAGVSATRVAIYEVPYNMAPDGPEEQRAYIQQLQTFLDAGRRGDAAALFMGYVGASDEMIDEARTSPMWPGLEALAPTLAYDAACMGDSRPPVDRLRAIQQPVLVLTGGASAESFVGGEGDFFGPAADAVTDSIPYARRESLEGQGHMVDPVALAPVLERFFNADG